MTKCLLLTLKHDTGSSAAARLNTCMGLTISSSNLEGLFSSYEALHHLHKLESLSIYKVQCLLVNS